LVVGVTRDADLEPKKVSVLKATLSSPVTRYPVRLESHLEHPSRSCRGERRSCRPPRYRFSSSTIVLVGAPVRAVLVRHPIHVASAVRIRRAVGARGRRGLMRTCCEGGHGRGGKGQSGDRSCDGQRSRSHRILLGRVSAAGGRRKWIDVAQLEADGQERGKRPFRSALRAVLTKNIRWRELGCESC
jgi:hypothetical protein